MSKTFAMKWPAEATQNQKMLLSRTKKRKKSTEPYSKPQKLSSESIPYVTLTI